MKQVNLVTIKTEDVIVGDFQEEMAFYENNNQSGIVDIGNSSEFMVCSADHKNSRVERLVRGGDYFYVCIHPDLWEWIYLIENPITAESQSLKIKNLKSSLDREISNLYKSELKRKEFINFNFLTRLKFLFFGAKAKEFK